MLDKLISAWVLKETRYSNGARTSGSSRIYNSCISEGMRTRLLPVDVLVTFITAIMLNTCKSNKIKEKNKKIKENKIKNKGKKKNIKTKQRNAMWEME